MDQYRWAEYGETLAELIMVACLVVFAFIYEDEHLNTKGWLMYGAFAAACIGWILARHRLNIVKADAALIADDAVEYAAEVNDRAEYLVRTYREDGRLPETERAYRVTGEEGRRR